MIRVTSMFFATVLAASVALAQKPPDQSGTGGKMGQQQNMSAMHDQMMKSMQADLDSMQSTLQKMKDQLSKVSDQSTKDQLQLNINMWQSLIENMNKHLTMMKQMTGPGHGTMMRGQQPPPPKQQPSPPK
jgi:TolA-binding protein